MNAVKKLLSTNVLQLYVLVIGAATELSTFFNKVESKMHRKYCR